MGKWNDRQSRPQKMEPTKFSTFKVFFTVIIEKPETWYGVNVD